MCLSKTAAFGQQILKNLNSKYQLLEFQTKLEFGIWNLKLGISKKNITNGKLFKTTGINRISG